MPDFMPTDAQQASEDEEVLGGHRLAWAMKNGGVDTVFALCGGHILSFLDGCLEAGIRVIDHRHEGSAAQAAEGWALATGQTGVCAITAGPGFVNGLIGLVDAGVWTLPFVMLAGRTGVARMDQGAVQDAPQAAIAAAVAKEVISCHEPRRIEAVAADALYHARAGKPGPVYLEIPEDMLHGPAPASDPLHGYPSEPPRPSAAPGDLARALELLERAEKPAILAGGGCFWSGAGDALTDLVEKAKIPVTTTSCARGLIPDSHEWCLGNMMLAGGAVLLADVVLVLGTEFNANVSMGRKPLFGDPDTQTVIQVDIRPESIGGNRRPDLALIGDVTHVLTELAQGWTGETVGREAWLKEADEFTEFVRSTWDRQIDEHRGERVHPGAAARDLVRWARDRLGTGLSFVADGGDALAWALAYMDAEGPGRTLHTTTALGTLGVGMPFAVAAQVARPDERAILFAGDGAFGFSAMEFDTAVRHGLPVIVVVANNIGWRDVTHGQDAWYGPDRHVASVLADTRYDRFAEALGGHGELVASLDEFVPALDRALDSGLPAVVNVQTDPAVLSDLMRDMGDLEIQ